MDELLVGGFKHFLLSIIYGIILPIDYSNIFQDGWNHQPDNVDYTTSLAGGFKSLWLILLMDHYG